MYIDYMPDSRFFGWQAYMHDPLPMDYALTNLSNKFVVCLCVCAPIAGVS